MSLNAMSHDWMTSSHSSTRIEPFGCPDQIGVLYLRHHARSKTSPVSGVGRC